MKILQYIHGIFEEMKKFKGLLKLLVVKRCFATNARDNHKRPIEVWMQLCIV